MRKPQPLLIVLAMMGGFSLLRVERTTPATLSNIEIKDSNGKTRIFLGLDESEDPILLFFGKSGEPEVLRLGSFWKGSGQDRTQGYGLIAARGHTKAEVGILADASSYFGIAARGVEGPTEINMHVQSGASIQASCGSDAGERVESSTTVSSVAFISEAVCGSSKLRQVVMKDDGLIELALGSGDAQIRNVMRNVVGKAWHYLIVGSTSSTYSQSSSGSVLNLEGTEFTIEKK